MFEGRTQHRPHDVLHFAIAPPNRAKGNRELGSCVAIPYNLEDFSVIQLLLPVGIPY